MTFFELTKLVNILIIHNLRFITFAKKIMKPCWI